MPIRKNFKNNFLKNLLERVKLAIRTWLGIKDPSVFMGLDYGWNDYSALVLIKRTPSRNDVVDIINFPPGTPFNDIQKACRNMASRYGVKEDNFAQDGPMGHKIKLREY